MEGFEKQLLRGSQLLRDTSLCRFVVHKPTSNAQAWTEQAASKAGRAGEAS